MNAYKTYAQVDATGCLALKGLPFKEGTLVEVLVLDQGSPKGRAELVDDWRAMMKHVQALPQLQNITDEDIAAEVDAYRSGL